MAEALGLLLSNERMDAARALEIGLVHRVVPRDILLQEAFAKARELGAYPGHLVKALKEAVRRGMDLPLEEALELELQLAARVIAAR
jgi:enoyl-CoA hydratase/carnithine racemase